MKLAVFGGAFDPLHTEHLSILNAVERAVAPDRLLIVPTADPPHKTGLIAPYEARVAMLKAAFGARFEISRLEEELHGKNYSLSLARELHRRYPEAEILFVLGGDSVRDLKIWHKPEELSKLVTFIGVPRDDGSDYREAVRDAERRFGARIFTVDYVGADVSSSVLKGKLLLNLPVSGEIPAGAVEYIETNGLYRDYDGILAKLKTAVSNALYAHSVRTALFALKFCSKLTLQFRDVFLAAMFHDCAKESPAAEMPETPPAVSHQFTGAETAQTVYGIDSEAVLRAIRCHTTGNGAMSRLDKLIFAADKLEEGREYPGAEQLRQLLKTDFERGFAALVRHNHDYLTAAGANIHPLQRELYQSLKGDQHYDTDRIEG